MKNVLLFLICFFLLHATTFAQEEEPKFRLELSIQSILTVGNVFEHPYRYQISEKLYNHATQFSAFWHFGKRAELGIGLAYANRDTKLLNPCEACFRPFTLERFIEYTPIRSIEMPIEMRWNWWKKQQRIKPYTSLGINNHLPMNFYAGPSGDKTRLDFSDFYMGLTLSIGSRIPLFEKWFLVLAASAEKNKNFKFANKKYLPQAKTSRWLDEWSVKVGVSRGF